MCTSDCRTFLWGGDGQSTRDAEGRLSCICEDEGWSDRNILGCATCIPVNAHRTFGWVGLVVSVGLFLHSACLFYRQRKFHERKLSAATSPVERCRRQLHIVSAIVAAASFGYFLLVLEDRLQWSVAVGALAQIPKFIGGAILTIRMWMYTNDPRLLRRSPELFAVSSFLESAIGHAVACCVASTVPTIAAVLALIGDPESAFRLMILGGVFVAIITLVIFWRCGRSLVRAIDKSLEQEQQQQQLRRSLARDPTIDDTQGSQTSLFSKAFSRHSDPRGGNPTLVAARRKVKSMVVLTTLLVVPSTSVGLFAALSRYMAEAALILDALLTLLPMAWLSLNTQLHAGRSHERIASRAPPPSACNGGLYSPRSIVTGFRNPFSRQQLVVPTEAPC